MASDISFRSLVISQNIGSAVGRQRRDSLVTAQGHLRQVAWLPLLAVGRAAGRHSWAPRFPRTEDLGVWLNLSEAPNQGLANC